MANPLLWVEALAGLKALYDVIQTGVEYAAALRRHLAEPDTIAESQRVAEVFSTYSDEEVEQLVLKINGCRDRFMSQGSGSDRSRCFCSILNENKDGNGGELPHIDDWERMFDQLKCGV